MHRLHSLLPAAAIAMLAAATHAQNPQLALDVNGGTVGGSCQVDVYPGLYPFEPCLLMMGLTSGPTPISIVDPADSRSVRIGLNGATSSFNFFPISGPIVSGPTTIPNIPSLAGSAFFFQAVTFGGSTTLVDRISNPAAMRLGTAGSFINRASDTSDDRAFGQVIPRADRRWMVLGGGSGALLAQIAFRTTEIYDDLSNSFIYGPSMTTERSLHRATQLLDGRWLITGGVNYNNDPQALCEIYDPVADTFTACASMLSPRTGHTATLLPDGRVFVSGGLAAVTVLPTPLEAIYDTTDTSEVYDPVANTWSPGPAMRTPRAGHLAMLRPNGTVMLAGGISWDDLILFRLPAVRNSTDIYDPAGNSISAGPSMSTPHSLVDPVDLGNDRWLVAGGISSLTLLNPGTSTTVAEVYDAAANTFTAAGVMATARGNHQAVALGGGRFLVAGGADGTILAPNPLASGEVYDANTNSWSAGPSFTVPRAGASVIVSPRGQWHVIGGGTAGGAITRSSEFFYF